MFINTYNSSEEFYNTTQNFPTLFKLGFIRDQFGLKDWKFDWLISNDIEDLDSDGIFIQILRALPIIGTVMGISRIYSVWSTNTLDDSLKDKIIHTIVGLIETCGLGVITLIMKIFYFILANVILAIVPPCVRIRRGSEAEENMKELLIDTLSFGL
ncbi:hypothetical protein C834K_0602 [Chlamydia poikilotherma]|uniref:Uncharacterized protein n=1 Tax=Chlamydia poikilotherma TaxID=1967783 RepID=A0A3B0PW29_9CHLA|nr:hypothetical protein [Chlamydia poikilotherma]SYX09056.1 hypothetical protein C834K_0602 [Chlamydia poikilotherma]